MKIEVNSRKFATAWEAMMIVAAEDSGTPVLDSTALIEVYEDHGMRLVATDSYVLARTWVPFDPEGDNLEPEVEELPDETFIVADADRRGIGLLKYVRKLHKKEPDEAVPNLTITRLQDESEQGVLEGMETELLHFSWPLHEDISLPLVDGTYPDWRHLENDRVDPQETTHVSFSSITLGSLAKLAELYKGYSVDWAFRGSLGIIDFKVGPVTGLVMPTRPTRAPDA